MTLDRCAPAAPVEPEGVHGSGELILLVEDDQTLARTLARNLAARGYQVEVAISVAEARAALTVLHPSLVLLDIDLPDGSGWQVVPLLRGRDGGRVPVIVISALRPNTRIARELKCTAMLEKPFPIETLLNLIEVEMEKT